MASLKFWSKPKGKAHRTRGAAALLPELFEIPASARRANRLLGVVALFGGFGTLALAVALTPGAQQSASSADAAQVASQATAQDKVAQDKVAQDKVAQDKVALNTIAPLAAPVDKANESAVTVAALPQRAAKADRLAQTSREPEAGSSEHLPDADIRGSMVEAEAPVEVAPVSEPDPEREIGPDFALGYPEPPPPGDTSLEDSDITDAGDDFTVEPSAAAGDDETAAEVPEAASVPAIDEEPAQTASLEPPAEAEPEEAKTHTAAVKSDVNMRTGPDNKAKVIKALPRNSKVEVIGCNVWCEVVYAGKRGYIYKSFIPGAKS